MNLNKVFVLGRLTQDPDRRQLPSGQPVVSFGVATNRVYTNKEGKKQEEAEFHNMVIFARTAEIAHQYLRKGSLALFEGRLRTRNWKDASTGQKKYRTEIIVERMQLGPRSTNPQGFASSPVPSTAPQPAPAFQSQIKPSITDEEIPVIQEEPPAQNTEGRAAENVEQAIEESINSPSDPFGKQEEEIDVKDIPF